jgi:hypothetical protein
MAEVFTETFAERAFLQNKDSSSKWGQPDYRNLHIHMKYQHSFICGSLLDSARFFSFSIFYTVSKTPWKGDQPVARPLPAHRPTQTHNKCTQSSMPRVGFEPTTPVFERAETVHASDGAATVTGKWHH